MSSRDRDPHRFFLDEYEALRHSPVPGDWAERAACRGMDLNMFFPSRGEMTRTRERLLTKTCRSCPVLAYCRTYALRYPLVGWWGAMSEVERRQIRRERRQAS